MTIESFAHSANVCTARSALERVCSGACPSEASRYYSRAFVDHVNGETLIGTAGIEKSVARYKRFIADLAIAVQDQLSEGDRVTCRFVVSGSVLGRKVSFDGITISRMENGLIAEDWSVTDTLGMLRQIGLWRTLRIALWSI